MRLAPMHRSFLNSYAHGAFSELANQDEIDPSTINDPLAVFILTIISQDCSLGAEDLNDLNDVNIVAEARITLALRHLLTVLEEVIQLRRAMSVRQAVPDTAV